MIRLADVLVEAMTADLATQFPDHADNWSDESLAGIKLSKLMLAARTPNVGLCYASG